MESKGWWSKQEDEELKARLKKDVMAVFKHTETLKRHELKELFSDVYGGEEPWNIVGQPLFSLLYQQFLIAVYRRSNGPSWLGC